LQQSLSYVSALELQFQIFAEQYCRRIEHFLFGLGMQHQLLRKPRMLRLLFCLRGGY
jgi:hypothetical protein